MPLNGITDNVVSLGGFSKSRLLKLASFNGKGSFENVIIGFLSDLAWPKAISLSSILTSVEMYKKRVGEGKVGSNSCTPYKSL